MNPQTKRTTRATRTTRTVLAVPGHRFKMLESAAASAADAVFIDLEDAVPPDQKDEALKTAVRALADLDKSIKLDPNSADAYVNRGQAYKLAGDAKGIADDYQEAIADYRKAHIVELRYFGGLSVEETAEALSISSPTVLRDWSGAKAWLYREITSGHGES